MRSRLSVCMGLLLLFPSLVAAGPATQYTLTPIDALTTIGIGRTTDELIRTRLVAGRLHAFVGPDPGTDLGLLHDGTETVPHGVVLGRVAGQATTGPFGFQTHAFRWTLADGLLDLGTAGDPALFSAATGLNATRSVGYGTLPTGTCPVPLLWPDAQPVVQLPTLEGGCGFVQTVNEADVSVGAATVASGRYHAARWTASGIDDLHTLGDGQSVAMDINAAGVIVGTATLATGQRAFVRRDDATGMTLLEPLAGDTASDAVAVNDAGDVVGGSTLIDPQEARQRTRLVVWGVDGVPVEILPRVTNGAGWTLDRGMGISDSGLLVGLGTIAGIGQGFLLVPVLEAPVVPESPKPKERPRRRER